ncbi:NACHT domain-containing protein [Streptomyces sp. KM273126]|uniref:NACHT domain-containing protein n=1 Tax=Streptomyces sp. KM273126 TaxID=2545247 RepID=UPI00103B1849|nr:NACHT domain-containing protein [Streptomyces sp. KM273126]MBA2806928.1 NACHT domain-containing protein [Streptomyces sp. KM273126]
MLSGAEMAILASAQPVLERAAGSALGKMIPSPMNAIRERVRNRGTRKRIKAEENDRSEAGQNNPEFARSLMDYLQSIEFSTLAMSISVNQFTISGKRKQIKGLEAAKRNLADAISSLPGAGEIDIEGIVGEVWQSLVSSIVEKIDTVRSSESFPASSRAAVVRMAASFARADMYRSKFLRDAELLADYYEFEEALKEQVKSLHATMKLPHAGTTRRVAYSRLFVEPTFSMPGESVKNRRYIGQDTPTLSEIIATSHRTVILGDPGGGKSTLSLKLAYDIARNASCGASAKVPFLVILRDYTRDFEAGKTTMIEYLENLCKTPYNLEPPAGFVEYSLSAGRAFVIFDGLDELIDTSLRRRVVDLVESFAYKYPMVPVLVTTRKVGYEEAPLDGALFGDVQLSQLADSAVKAYAEKWFSLDTSLERHRREELARSFYQDSRFVADLTRNPLMLSLMCGIYASENYIPANRPEVYKKCTELLFDKWDKQRGIVTPLPFDAHVKYAINALAYSIYSHPDNQSGLSRDQLISFVQRFLLEKRFEDEYEAEDAATQFVDFCTGRAWVLSNVGSDTAQELYGFTHRTFLEYFAANQLVRLNPTAERLFMQLREKIGNAEWDVVSQLALQIVGNNTENGTDDFLERVIEAASDSNLSQEANLIAFASRSLSFAVPKPSLVRMICNASVELALRITDPGSSNKDDSLFLRGLRSLLHANRENLPSVAKNLRSELLADGRIDGLDELDRATKLALALCISTMRYTGVDDMLYMDDRVEKFWESFEVDNFEIFAAAMQSLADSNSWVAMQGANSGMWSIQGVITRFGPEVLFQFSVGSLILRAPFVLFMSDSAQFEDYPQMRAVPQCLIDLSEILPTWREPWFKSDYDYQPIGQLDHRGYGILGRTLSQVPGQYRDALILIAAAWAELASRDKNWVTRNGRSDNRISGLAVKWNAARLDRQYAPKALRSIRACQLKSETMELLADWVEGKYSFVGNQSLFVQLDRARIVEPG